jgi:hypothetical protein
MKLILTKVFLIAGLLSLQCVFSQTQKKSDAYIKLQREFKYEKAKNYKGPEGKPYTYPAQVEQNSNSVFSENLSPPSSSNSSPKGTLKYSPNQIKKSRASKNKTKSFGKGTGGSKPVDPKISTPEPINFPDLDLKIPEINPPKVEPPSFSTQFWKGIFFIIIFILIIFLVYLIVKNYKATSKKINQNVYFEEEWNPEIISKSELESRLEEALKSENYRECVRVYFTFILKELIQKKLIHWKKELTNYDYLLQLKSKNKHLAFEKTVYIYDLVWYGNYKIKLEEYKMIQPQLDTYYQQVKNE